MIFAYALMDVFTYIKKNGYTLVEATLKAKIFPFQHENSPI